MNRSLLDLIRDSHSKLAREEIRSLTGTEFDQLVLNIALLQQLGFSIGTQGTRGVWFVCDAVGKQLTDGDEFFAGAAADAAKQIREAGEAARRGVTQH